MNRSNYNVKLVNAVSARPRLLVHAHGIVINDLTREACLEGQICDARYIFKYSRVITVDYSIIKICYNNI